MRSPDRWANETGRVRAAKKAWHDYVPSDVRQLVAVSTVSAAALAEWFRTEVADAYPNEEWPKQATYSKVVKLIGVLRAES